jgi:hypothetical protein
MKGLRSILAFFNKEAVLDTVIVALDPNLFESVIAGT